MRKRQQHDALHPEMGNADMRPRPVSETFSSYASNRHSQARLASTAATLSDRDSQQGKEYGPDGITFHHAAAPSPAAFAQTLRTCSPAPSAGAGRSSLSVAEAFAAASRNPSPAIAQGPFTPPSDGQADRSVPYGNLTTEPEPLSRSGTGSLRGAHPPSLGGAFKKIHAAFHRGSTRSSGSESRGTDARSLDMDMDQLDQAQTAHAVPYLRDDKPQREERQQSTTQAVPCHHLRSRICRSLPQGPNLFTSSDCLGLLLPGQLCLTLNDLMATILEAPLKQLGPRLVQFRRIPGMMS